jgi:Zn-dependent protease
VHPQRQSLAVAQQARSATVRYVGTSGSMHELLGWNLNLGCLFGVRVRVHAVFVLLVVVSVGWSLRTAGDDLAGPAAFWLLLMLSVLAHEAGHRYAALRVAGRHDEWLLWPLGGLTQPQLSPDPAAQCLVALAGPLVNLSLFLTAAVVLLVCGLAGVEQLSPFSLPYEPPLDLPGAIRLLAWINAWLLLINLLPAFPLDGGPALRAALSVGYGPSRAAVLARSISVGVGLALCLAALVVPHDMHFELAWLAPILLGLVVLLGAVRESAPSPRRWHGDADWPPGQDLSRRPSHRATSPSSSPSHPPGSAAWHDERSKPPEASSDPLAYGRPPHGPWEPPEDADDFPLAEPYAAPVVPEQATQGAQGADEPSASPSGVLDADDDEIDEDRRLDEILMRLHAHGRESLSPDDLQWLQRASARYRRRLQARSRATRH